MLRRFLLVGAAGAAVLSGSAFAEAEENAETVVVTAQKLDEARNGIQTQIGASTYTLDSAAIEAQPGGENNPLNQVILQAPGVVQDSFGQLHIRAEHNALQYRLNGVILPEGISVFSQTLDPRLADQVKLITGALPAEYGLVTGGIVDVQTKSGLFDNGGEVSIYGGSHGEIHPSASYGGSNGDWNYFVTGDYLQNGLGIESPDGSADPLHDETSQYHLFGYGEDILDSHSRIAIALATSHDNFQIPDTVGQSAGFDVLGGTPPLSQNLSEKQREITHFGTVSYLRSQGAFDFQVSAFARLSTLGYTPDSNLGDLFYTGISQAAYKRDIGYGIQAEAAYKLSESHTLRGGILLKRDDLKSSSTAAVLRALAPLGITGSGTIADPYVFQMQTSNVPYSIVDNGTKAASSFSVYLQDEWKLLDSLTLNYGLRYDTYRAYSKGDQISPRVNAVWQPLNNTTIHAGYARYFSPPPFELVGNETIAEFANPASLNTATPRVTLDDTPQAERADYYDVGGQQKFNGILTADDVFTFGVDSFLKLSRDLIDEGQFGAPIILTPFNYRRGRQYGIEFSTTYDVGALSYYGNLSFQQAAGKDIVSSEFNFGRDELAYIRDHFIQLDHMQAMTASAGISYLYEGTRVSADLLYGSGLRQTVTFPNDGHLPGYTQINLGVDHQFDLPKVGAFSIRFDVVNLFDEKYEIRNGTGVGVGAPQWGPRRGFFAGITKQF